mmetsp:Transcript_1965/g.2674  ORF Transcript_1965/g.2674 Transcript_1965/m.2674 type:complete len:192 (-) Transcript_1965:606-1181(-)
MYDMVYGHLVTSGIAEKLQQPLWVNSYGSFVLSQSDAAGLKTEHIMKHPEYIVFVDEVGNNTNMKKDGAVGGEKVFKHVGEKVSMTASVADTHFTVLGFTAGTGEPIMCAVIFAGTEITQVLFALAQKGGSHLNFSNRCWSAWTPLTCSQGRMMDPPPSCYLMDMAADSSYHSSSTSMIPTIDGQPVLVSL